MENDLYHKDEYDKYILDEYGEKIPNYICICAAYSDVECVCGAWDIPLPEEFNTK